jgi:hypothetical protein
MRKKMKDYLAAIYSPAIEPKLKKLLDAKLISDKDAETIRKSDDAAKKQGGHPPDEMDVLERSRGRPGIHARPHCRARRRVQGMHRGHQDGENPRLSGRHEHDRLQGNRRAEIEDMFKFLSSLEVDGHTISPGYEYDAAKKDMVTRLGKQPEDFFLTRRMTRQKFAKILDWGKAFTIFGTVPYQEFLAGKRELTCTAWAIPTYNVKGWKAPCYLMTDGHYSGYQEMLTRRCNGTNTASWTASRATRAAKIAWSTAATIPAARSARITSAATTGRTSNTTSARNRNRIRPRRNWRSALTTASPSAKAIWPRPRRPSIHPPPARAARSRARKRSSMRNARRQPLRHERHVRTRRFAGQDQGREEGGINCFATEILEFK